MAEAAAAPLAEQLLVDVAIPGGLSAGVGAAELGGLAGGLGGAGTVGSLFGGAGAGLGASGLGGIAGLSSLPVATALEASPLAMSQIGAALAPTATGTLAGYGLGGAASGLGAGAGLGTSAGLGAGSALGLGGATAGTALGTGASLSAGLGTGSVLGAGAGDLLSQSYIDSLVKGIPAGGPGVPVADLAGKTLPPLESAANAAKAAQIAENPMLKAIGETVAKTGLNPAASTYGTLAQGTSDLVGGGVEIPGEGSGIGNLLSQGVDWVKANPYKTMGGIAAYKLLNADKTKVPDREKYSGPLSKYQYDPNKYTPYTPQPPANPYQAQYARYAKGGIADLGGYSDGGRMLKGPGDGMSDSIPASIAGKQPARLANEEFVVPADVVSHLGNGSSDAGAKQLYSMMDRIRKARTGTKKQGRQINPSKYMPA